jgi:hypothetical protein
MNADDMSERSATVIWMEVAVYAVYSSEQTGGVRLLRRGFQSCECSQLVQDIE